jgi:hypothetical protein
MVVFIKLGIDFLFRQGFFRQGFYQGLKEGMDLEMPVLDITTCNYNVNLKFPYYDIHRNVFTDKNDYIYNNKHNILFYAQTNCDL